MKTQANKTALPNAASTQKVDANGRSYASTVNGGNPAEPQKAAPAPLEGEKSTPKKADAAPKAPKAPKEPKPKAEAKPRGQYAGKIIRLAKGVTENPRKEGTHGRKSFDIVLKAGAKGISYEDYKAAGGRLNDLQWDIDRNKIEAVTPEVAAKG